MVILRRATRRNAVIAVFLALLLIYYLTGLWNPHGPPESTRLSLYMNTDPVNGQVELINSTFDWSQLTFRYPPPPVQKPFPHREPHRLPRVQHQFAPEYARAAKKRNTRRQEVRQLFQKNWASYRQRAWMKDALLPVSGTSRNHLSGWAATLVDSLDTLWIMGLKEEFDEAVAAVAAIDFGKSAGARVDVTNTTVRYLGGLMAAYELSQRRVLLDKAVELGDLLYAGFDTANRLPVGAIDFARARAGEELEVEEAVDAAAPGTLTLEMTRLTQLTGDAKYYNAVTEVMDLFYMRQNQTRLPGMWPLNVSMKYEDFTSGGNFTMGSRAASLYGYLPKMVALVGDVDPKYAHMAATFLRTANESVLFRPMAPRGDDVLLPGRASCRANPLAWPGRAVNLTAEAEHAACSAGAVFALGGRLLARDDYVELGAKLARGCAWAHRAFPTGLMPARLGLVACPSRDECRWSDKGWARAREEQLPLQLSGQDEQQQQLELPKGFAAVTDPRYRLGPETIESLFVLYRVTGLPEFQEAAWDLFAAVREGTATAYANAAVLDVTPSARPLPQEDFMESYWLGATLKYFYLIFSPPDMISLDEYVLNAGAHPFLRSALSA